MNPRYHAVSIATERKPVLSNGIKHESDQFGAYVFNRSVMRKMLPKEIYVNLFNAMDGKERIKEEFADTIAVAMKEWAISHGATHYTHWFQPLTGASAEKHDSFIDWQAPDKVIQKFSGKELLQGEPDASSFPSGGLRSTFEARGYTGWDPTSPVFLWKGGDGITLCIPSIFFSWTGDILDCKIPLLRSDKKIQDSVLRLLKLTGIEANFVYSTLGLEQEYFVIDRAIRNLRPDLVLAGRTVFGAAPSKGQELQDHYFGSVKDRILSFMHEFEIVALKLGIPVKTRHNEVAPAQHEVAPVFEKASTAIDHNLLLMELMRQTAAKHHLACLIHEKPFHEVNGSGKHANWSLMTDTGINLLDPTDTPENNVHFLILLTAILTAVYDHAILLRAAIGSAANDYRLGGHEAPPAILSAYLGQELESVLESIEAKGTHERKGGKVKYDMGLPVIPDLSKDNTDRNRTSPFAFTGNKFEFRAVGASANPALAISILNTVVAHTLNKIMDEIEAHLHGDSLQSNSKIVVETILPILQKYLKHSKPIRFSGDNYSEEWVKEAEKRGLPNIHKSIAAFNALKSDRTIAAFEGVLTKQELESRYEIQSELYIQANKIEVKLMLELFNTMVLPAACKHQKVLADGIKAVKELLPKAPEKQLKQLQQFTDLLNKGITQAEELQAVLDSALGQTSLEARGQAFAEKVLPASEILREIVDHLETLTEDELWPLPKYREILFIV